MAYRTNPFLERVSERTASDQEFVRLFSPKILERLPDEGFDGGVHIFRSPPGGGKTTLMRAFTPSALQAFWNSRRTQDMSESYQRLSARGVLHEQDGPQLLGVMLSCASGYADLPPGGSFREEGLFRALLDCRIILRAIRSVGVLLGMNAPSQLDLIRLVYPKDSNDLTSIPRLETAGALARWAEQRERSVYAHLDTVIRTDQAQMPVHLRFEGVLWLQDISFEANGRLIAPNRLLMIDDVQRLRAKQRSLLINEITEMRLPIPIWLAERNIVLGEKLLAQGVRENRDVKEHALDELWNTGRGQHQFSSYAQNILDRRLSAQTEIPAANFAQYLSAQVQPHEIRSEVEKGLEQFGERFRRIGTNERYAEWISRAKECAQEANADAIFELYRIWILISRDENKKQMALELSPLSEGELDDRDNSQVQGAAEIFAHEDLHIPYYFGVERLCTLATNNVEELLGLAAALFEGLKAKQVLRKTVLLSAQEQEKLIKDAAKRKRDFIPKAHTEGTRAQRLLDSIGTYCRERTFLPNAPYAPGVTGVRLSDTELRNLHDQRGPLAASTAILRRVLFECVAENLLVARDITSSGSRESGTVFYLSRTLCAHYGLPLQMGGWQEIEVSTLCEWIEGRRTEKRRLNLQAT
jgi:hypothetical protein